MGKEYIGKAGFFNNLSLSINFLHGPDCWIESLYILANQIVICFLFTSVCYPQNIPMGTSFGILGTVLDRAFWVDTPLFNFSAKTGF